MARLQVLRLPEKTVAGVTETPFILIFDDLTDQECDSFIVGGHLPIVRERGGAADVMAFNFPIEVVQ